MKKGYSYLLLFLLYSVNVAFCQNHPILFDNHSGLPGNSVYDCAESNTGKLWIATDKGLAYYDGYSFKRVGLNDGLTTAFSWGFCKDSKGRLWLRNRQSPFTYIYNDSIYRVGSDKLQGINFDYLLEDKAGNIYISSHRFNKTHKIDVSEKVTTIDSVLVLINSRNEKIWGNDDYPFQKMIPHGDCLISAQIDATKPKQSIIEIWNTLTNKKEIVSIGFIDRFEHLSILDQKHILISSETGIFKLNIQTKQITPYNKLYNTDYKDVVVIYNDRFGNKWLCDYTKGIWLEKALAPFITYNNIGDLKPMYTSQINNAIVLTTKKGGFAISKKGFEVGSTIHFYQKQAISSNSYFLSFFHNLQLELFNGKGYLYGNKSNQLQNLPLGKWMSLQKANYSFAANAYKCHFVKNNLFAIGTANGIYCLTSKNEDIKLEQIGDGYVFDLLIVDSNIYSVGLKGLRKINLKSNESKLILDDQNLVNICLLDNFLFARREDGTILKINVTTQKVEAVIKDYKDIRRIKMVGNEIWGIGESRIVQFDANLTILTELNQFDGITSPHKLSIEKIADDYYLICESGYYKFNKSEIKRTYSENKTNFKIEKIVVNGKQSFDSTILLKGTNNFLEVHLQCIYFPFSVNNISFFYRINEGNWNESDQPIISILNLPYGKYDLEIKAKFKGSTTFFKKTILLHIDNPAPFYQSIWFLLLLFISLISIVAVAIIFNRKRKIKQLEQQFDITQNRMKMLVMQMKPHFLSNVFNSLQASFLEDDTIRSSQLIKDLDNYLRLSLSYSKKDVVSLYDEIMLTKQYLGLEQNRLTKKIELIISEDVKRQMRTIEVPVFILQPIIENAIWHGIQKSDRNSGSIIIDCNEEKDYFIITVEDNGVGLGNSNHKGNSVALDNINERLSLIDNKKERNYLFINALPIGTKVSLYVTKKIKNRPH